MKSGNPISKRQMANDQRSLYKPPRACAARGAAIDERKTNLVTRINTDNDLVRDAHATAPTVAGAEIKSGLEKLQYSDSLSFIKGEPNDARAVEALTKAFLADPLGVGLAIMDAENIQDAEDARALAWEKAFAEFAGSERIDPRPFKYAHLSNCRPHEYTRERKLLAEKPWLDFGRCWPYCIERAPGAPHLWVPRGRGYQALGQDQFGRKVARDAGCDAAIGWRFSDCDPLSIEGVWPRNPGWLYNDGLDSRRNCFARLGRLISFADDPHECARRLMLAWRSAYPPSPPSDALALAE